MTPKEFIQTLIFKAKAFHNKAIHIFRRYKYEFFLLIQQVGNKYRNIIDSLTILLSLFCISNIIWQIGYEGSAESTAWLYQANQYAIIAFAVIQILYLLTYYRSSHKVPISELIYTTLTWLYVWLLTSADTPYNDIIRHKFTVTTITGILSVYEISKLGISILSKRISPLSLFALSFIVIIAIGTGLLLMPRCSVEGLTFIEALFTSTSAVCVSGLSILNIADSLTLFGQIIILILIQVGGIGVMTFTCFFALSVTGKASFQNRIVIKELINAESVADIFSTLKRIIMVTLCIELSSAWLIYEQLTAHPTHMEPSIYTMFTAIFHAISAFCNAGFSNIQLGLSDPLLSNNIPLIWIISLTVFLGGSGFPIQSSVIDWVKHHIKKVYYHLTSRQDKLIFQSRLINANIRLIFLTHLALFIIGIVVFFITEYYNQPDDSTFLESLTDALVLSTMTRTAGFNTVDLCSLMPITLAIATIMMWIGCAPLSTGGGIKTSTFALAMLNLKRILHRRDNIEVYNRRVAPQSIDKAFAVIILSLMFIATTTIALKLCEPHLPLTKLFFESVSAICTSGMTLDITPTLSTTSHMILIVAMFVGRIGILSFLIIFISPAEKQYYKYPYENITI